MQSQLTVRLSDDLDEGLSVLSKKLRLKRSDIVRMALERFLEEFEVKEEEKPYEKVKNLIGSISSGISDLGEAHRKYLLKQFKRHA
jgi:predicted DNA-binding protein